MFAGEVFEQSENIAIGNWRSICLMAVVSLVVLIPSPVVGQVVEENDHAGVYLLESVDGGELPATILHGGVEVEVRAGTFTIRADGTCVSRTTFGPPTGDDVTREVTATFTKDGSALMMQWKGGGRTEGTVNGDRFSMVNEQVVFSYMKQPGNKVLDRFLGSWRSVQTQGTPAGEEVAVDLTYSRRLGGKFVQELGKVSGQDAAMIMYTYDADAKVFRLWRFAASDPPSEATGKWNAETRTLEWTYVPGAGQDFTMTASHRFLGDNAFAWDVVGRDSTGKVLFQVKGKALRTEQSKN